MTRTIAPEDERRLELARRAFIAARPSEREIDLAVRRVTLRLAHPALKRRRTLQALVIAVLTGGGLAYAHPGALQELAGRARAVLDGTSLTASRHSGSAERAPAAAAPLPAPAPQRSEQPTAAVPLAAPPIASAPPSGTETNPLSLDDLPPLASSELHAENAPSATRKPAARKKATWGQVGQALADGNEAAAMSALSSLAQGPDPATRAKAALGMAQLMLGRGEYRKACGVAFAIVQREDLPERIRDKARELIAECQK